MLFGYLVIAAFVIVTLPWSFVTMWSESVGRIESNLFAIIGCSSRSVKRNDDYPNSVG